MYPGDPMQIMQCIYSYFTLPNLLILTTMNHDMLYQYILCHYSERTKYTPVSAKSPFYVYDEISGGYFPVLDSSSSFSRRDTLCREQSDAYLRKIIPNDLRIVMPSWRKSDYKDICTKIVLLMNKQDHNKEKTERENLFDKEMKALFPRLVPGRVYYYLKQKIQKEKFEITVKQFLFMMIADRLGVYLNPNGYKQHFMEPDGLRSTCELFDTLYLMHNIREENPETVNKYLDPQNHDRVRENYKIILDTFYFKMLPNLNLDDSESKMFDIIIKETPARRGKAVIDCYYKIKNQAYDSDAKSDVYNPFDYSIGELFRIIHHASRNGVFTKNFVKAILASFSFILPFYSDEAMFEFYKKEKEYENAPDDIKPDKPSPFADDKIKTLFNIFGGSLLGNWAYEMFGDKALRIRFNAKKLSRKDDKFSVLLKCLMFIRLDDLHEKESISFLKVRDKDVYELDFDLDPTAYIINIMQINEFTNIVREKAKQSTDEFNKLLNKWEDRFNSFSGKDWDEDRLINKYPLFPFPVHQVDLAYSVIKRAVRDITYFSDNELKTKSHPKVHNDIVKILKDFYQNIFKELLEVQQDYPILNEKLENHSVFAKTFAFSGSQLGIWSFDIRTKIEDLIIDDMKFEGKGTTILLENNGKEIESDENIITWAVTKTEPQKKKEKDDGTAANNDQYDESDTRTLEGFIKLLNGDSKKGRKRAARH